MCFLNSFAVCKIFSYSKKKKTPEVLNKIKRKEYRQAPSIHLLCADRGGCPSYYGGAAPLIHLSLDNRIKYYKRLDLLEVFLNKDGAMCSLQLQGNWTSDKLMREERNRPLKMFACHWAINSFPNYFSVASCAVRTDICPGDLPCLMNCGEATIHPCRSICMFPRGRIMQVQKHYEVLHYADLFFMYVHIL